MTCDPEPIVDITQDPNPTGDIQVFFQDTAPTVGLVTGDLWVDSAHDRKLKRYSGTAWEDVSDLRFITLAATDTSEQAARMAADEAFAVKDAQLTAADVTLQDHIDAEAATRTQADIDLNTRIDDAIISAGGGGNKTFRQASAPVNPADMLLTGDLWVDSDDGNKLYRWSGSQWIEITDQRVLDALISLGLFNVQINDPTTGLAAAFAAIANEAIVRASSDSSLSSLIGTVQAQINNPTTGLANAYAKITQEATARASADVVEANARQVVEAGFAGRLLTRPNLLYNGGFENGTDSWALVGTITNPLTTANFYAGLGATWLAQGTSWIRNDTLVPVQAGQTYTLTGDVRFQAASGSIGFVVQWLNLAGVVISDSPLSAIAPPVFFSTLDLNRMQLAQQMVAPVNAVNARVFAQVTAGVSVTSIAVRQIKFEAGPLPATPYTMEGAVIGSYASVTEEISARIDDTGQIKTHWGIVVDANNRIIGSLQLDGTNTSSDFIVVANRFKVVDPSNALTPTAVLTLVTTAGVREFILGAPQKSTNYLAGSLGYRIDNTTGNAEFNIVTIRDFALFLRNALPTFTNDYTGLPLTSRGFVDSDQLSIRAHAPTGTKIRYAIGQSVTSDTQYWPWLPANHGGTPSTDSDGNTIPGREGVGPNDFAGFILSDGAGGMPTYQHTAPFHVRVCSGPTFTTLGPEAVVVLTWVPEDMSAWPQVPAPFLFLSPDNVAAKGAANYTIRASCIDAAATLYKSIDGVSYSVYTRNTNDVMAADKIHYFQAKRGTGYRDSGITSFANTATGVPNSGGDTGGGGPGGGRSLP